MALNEKFKPTGLDVSARLKNKINTTDTPTHTHTYEYTDIIENETRSKRLNLLAKPSVHRKLDDYAKAHGNTFNNLVHTLMEEFIEKNNL